MGISGDPVFDACFWAGIAIALGLLFLMFWLGGDD